MTRALIVLSLLLLAGVRLTGQTCFTVSGPDGRAVREGTVQCIGQVHTQAIDSLGGVCVQWPCDSMRIVVGGFAPRTLSLEEARITGVVFLDQPTGELNEVVVEPWPHERDRHALASTAVLDSTLTADFERSSLRGSAQWAPGVQWDERGHGGSPRLSIRGSMARSVYGTRGVKAYWGPFPITLADGSTPIELLDPLLVGSLDIGRSVGNPNYGSAPSGLVLAGGPFREGPGIDAMVEATGGSFGYYRLGALGRTNKNGTSLTVGVVHQRNTGYRQQESSARDQVFLTAAYRYKRTSTRVFATWQNAGWDLPGSVDEQTMMSAPRTANPYSILVDAHIEKQQLMTGVSNELRLGGITVRTGVHGQMIDKTNPYGTSPLNCGYKEETARALGARLTIGADRLFTLPLAWNIGLEALSERDHLRELYYTNGIKGDIKLNGDTRISNLNAFATTVARLGRTTTLHAGVGLERTGYDHTDEMRRTRAERETSPVVLPYSGVEQDIGQGYRLRLRYAESISRATVWELLGADGTLSDQLRGERVREWELGADNAGSGGPVRADVSLYHRLVKDMITQRPGYNDGPAIYDNADQASIMGMELLVNGPVITRERARMEVLGTCTVSASDLRNNGQSEGDIPGVPLLMAGLLVRTDGILLRGLGLEAGARMTSGMATGGAATDPTHVEHLRVSWRTPQRAMGLSVFVHVENLLDTRYSGWITTNAPGGRYYNPAPARSVFFGVRLHLASGPEHSSDT